MPFFILLLIFNAAALLLTAYIVPGFIITHLGSAILAAVVIGIVNAVIRPILLIITLPINLLTLGLFTIIINAITLWLASLFVPGFHIDTALAAILGVIVLSLVSTGLHLLLRAYSKYV